MRQACKAELKMLNMLLKTVLFAILVTAYARPGDSAYNITVGPTCRLNNVTADKVEQAKILIDESEECISMVQDSFQRLATELKENQTDRFAKMFCAKAPEIINCYAKYVNATGICEKQTQSDILHTINVYKHLVDYMCSEEDHKTRLAMSIEDGLIECFKIRHPHLPQCINTVRQEKISQNDLDKFSKCVTENMKACSSSLGLQAEHLFEYVRNNYYNVDNMTTTLGTTPKAITAPKAITTPIINKLFNINIDAKFSISVSEV